MTFHTAYVPIVVVSIALAVKLQNMATFQPALGQVVAQYKESCPQYGTSALNDFLCIIEPFFKDLVTNEIGKAFLTAFGTSGAVMSVHLLLRGARSDASFLFSPLITAVVVLAGQVLGAGFVQLALIPLFLAISKTLAPRSTAAPSPPSFVYIATTLLIQFTVFVISIALTAVPTSNPAWTQVNLAFQAFPTLFLPLFFLSFIPPPTAKSEPTPTLGVSALTFFKYIYVFPWWGSLAQGLTAYRAGEPFTPQCYFMALDLSAFVLSFVGMYAVDAVAGDAPMGVARMLGGMLVFGPASTMAAYFGKQERILVEQAEAEKRKA